MESGSGIISSLQGIGSGRSRSLFPSKMSSCALLILYFTGPMKLASFDVKHGLTYQTLCEDLKLILDFEALLFKNAYTNQS